MDIGKIFYCFFCGKSQYEVCKLIVGLSVFICDECVELCNDIICEEFEEKVQLVCSLLFKLCEIFEVFDQYVIGQNCVKCMLVVVVYNYYKCIESWQKNDDVELVKLNILLVGLIGLGKMLLVEILVCLFNVLFIMVDVIMLIEVGYVGEDVENIIQKLLQKCDYDVEKVQQGIVYIDEIDKILCKSENLLIICDVFGEGVQQVLLKLIEGIVVSVLLQGGCKYLQQEFLQVDIKNILFICGGVFVGLDKVIQVCFIDVGSIGFGVKVKSSECKQEVGKVLVEVELEDLIKFGLIFEFVGCLLVVVILEELDELVLIKILIELKNVIIKQFKKLFEMENVELEFCLDVLLVIVRKVFKCKIGVCGLCIIVELVLLDIMYDLLLQENVSKVVVDELVIEYKFELYLIYQILVVFEQKVVGVE